MQHRPPETPPETVPESNGQTVAETLAGIPAGQPVLIAGPTAAGKSALALAIARRDGGRIINADALQVYENWRILTARPDPGEEALVPHALYGHVRRDTAYSVGAWLRDLAPLLRRGPRPIIVGGTGLYFAALTEGLAEIPPTAPEIRARGQAILQQHGIGALLEALDPATLARIDRHNPARVARAWEVQMATGRGLAAWQDETPPPLLPRARATALLVTAGRDWLGRRIARRFDAMLAAGALEEARANLAGWDPSLPSCRAIGAPELIAHLRGESDLATARRRAIIASRQYAKRQRSWFRARMGGWTAVAAERISA